MADSGHEHMQDVIGLLFKYVSLLQQSGVHEWIFNEDVDRVREDIQLLKLQNEAAEEAKMQALRDLEATNRLIEELKLNLESAQAEELQAKQDSEVIKLRVKESWKI